MKLRKIRNKRAGAGAGEFIATAVATIIVITMLLVFALAAGVLKAVFEDDPVVISDNEYHVGIGDVFNYMVEFQKDFVGKINPHGKGWLEGME